MCKKNLLFIILSGFSEFFGLGNYDYFIKNIYVIFINFDFFIKIILEFFNINYD